jgi:hypothetical protein
VRDEGAQKVYWWGRGKREMGGYCCFAKVYSWLVARAGFLDSISFFFRLIGFKG